MGDQIKILSFELNAIVALMITLSASEPCDIQADVCEYKFIVTYQLTMMKGRQQVKAMKGKLYPVKAVNISSANQVPDEDVITMDGYSEPRLVIAINGTIPGPPIEAYIGQTVVVHVENHLYSSGVTIHWHGLHQKNTPFMDGVPYLTQCPIGPSQSFTYRFNLTQTGTHWYHSHSGTQRTMGLYGAIIIRERKPMTIQEHVMVVTDYNNHFDSILIFVNTLHGLFGFAEVDSCLVNGRGRAYDEKGVHNEAPIAKFTVKQGNQYRFRVISASSLHHFEVSVDGHRLKIVASDGSELEPYITDALVIQPGERYDFIITANQTIGNYWIRGVFPGKNHKFEAILRYEGALAEEPNSVAKNCTEDDPCVVINCGTITKTHKCVPFSNMNSSFDHEVPPILPGKWKEHFLNFAFPGIPGIAPSSVNGRVYKEPSVNPLYQPLEVDTLCGKENCGSDRLCTCTNSLALNKDDTVQMVFLNLGIGAFIEHPIHMHGHSFSVLKMGYPSFDATGKRIHNPDIDCRGDPKINYCNDAAWRNPKWGGDNIPGIKLKRAPLKDTIIIPPGGYAVIRIKADNPGLWFMHCHTETHSLNGMAMILNESFADVGKAPDHFPVCRSFTHESISHIPTLKEAGSELERTTPSIHPKPDSKEDRELEKMTLGVLIAVICVLALAIIILIVGMIRMNHRQTTKSVQSCSFSINPGFEK